MGISAPAAPRVVVQGPSLAVPCPALELLKDTPLEVAWRVWQARPPVPSLTIVIKGTFELVPTGECPLAPEQALPLGDEHHDQDPACSLRYASDLEPLKPRGECLAIASFHAPGGRAVPQSMVSMQVGSVRKQLAIYGDRHWQSGRASDAQPIASLPLTWENAFGGEGFDANPVGKGLGRKIEIEGKQVLLLPNVEDPHATIGSRDARPAPQGFGPIPRTWKSRMSLAGTYDARWQAERYPYFPVDLDWECFNAAPRDQRIEGFFRGDEEIRLMHLHAKHPQIECRLPGLMPRVCLIATSGDIREVGLRMDTITIDADASLVYVIWRGVTEIVKEDLSDIAHLFAVHDRIRAPRSEAALAGSFANMIAIQNEEDEKAEAEKAPRMGPEGPGAKWAHLDQAMTMRGDDAALQAALHQARGRGGALRPLFEDALGLEKPMSVERQLTPEDLLELEMQLALGSLPHTAPEDPREQVKQALRDRSSLAGKNLTGADLSGLDIVGLDMRRVILSRANMSGTHFEQVQLDGAMIDEAEISLAVFERCSLVEADLSSSRAERVRFDECVLERARFTDAYLRESRWSACKMKRAELMGSDLTQSGWRECALDEADLSRSLLEQAFFQECTLIDAWLEGGVRAARARLDGCEATLLRASEGADFEGASFRKAILDGARFSDAKLRGANFSLARLSRADFSRAMMVEAQMMGCDLRMARFDGAVLFRATLLKSNLMQARFEGANLRAADLRGCNLYQAELLRATLDDARLDLADVHGTRIG